MAEIKIKEKNVLQSCKALLDVYRKLGRLDYFRITTTGRPKDGGFYSNPDQKGFPDVLVWLRNGPDLYIEVKSRTGKLSPSQTVFKERALEMGRYYCVVRSSTELSLILDKFLGQKNPIS